MAKKQKGITDKDVCITDLEEISDLLSEVGTSLADQDYSTAEADWDDAKTKFAALAKNMRDLFNQDNEAGEDDD